MNGEGVSFFFCGGPAALNSGGPFLLLKGQRPGYTRQQEGILRALWVANVTGSTVVLPQFFMSYDSHPVEATTMEKYFNIRHFILPP